MKILKALASRFALVTGALLIQVLVLVLLSTYFESFSHTAYTVIRIASFVVIFTILNQVKNPSIAMTWIVFVLITPVFGSMVYILVGSKRPGKKMRKKFEKTSAQLREYTKIGMEEAHLKEKNEEVYKKSRYLRRQGFPVCENTSVEYFPLGDDAFPVMLRELEKAEKFIFMEYFILDKGEMLDKIVEILQRKAKSGVDVRVIYDDMGSLFTLPHNYCRELEKKGIKCFAFNRYVPVISAVMNHRSHRKMLVIDSRVAFTGGINIADEYINKKEKYGHWKDNCVMLSGESAKEFTLLFLEMWRAFRKDKDDLHLLFEAESNKEEGVFVQPFSDTPVDDELVGENIFVDAINKSERYIYIFTPYLIPDTVLIRSLDLAAKRGVDVRILVPGIPDKKIVYTMTKSFYAPLINAGVKIYKYNPGFLHAKGFVSDDFTCCVGTINMDFRSMYHHFECGCMIYGEKAAESIKKDFTQTLEKSERVELKEYIPGIISTSVRAIIRLIAPLV